MSRVSNRSSIRHADDAARSSSPKRKGRGHARDYLCYTYSYLILLGRLPAQISQLIDYRPVPRFAYATPSGPSVPVFRLRVRLRARFFSSVSCSDSRRAVSPAEPHVQISIVRKAFRRRMSETVLCNPAYAVVAHVLMRQPSKTIQKVAKRVPAKGSCQRPFASRATSASAVRMARAASGSRSGARPGFSPPT